jgi:hypothetical protein
MSKKKIPTEITIEGKVLKVKDVPELLELIEAARGEEKDKLYGEIATLEAKVTGLEDKGKLTEKEAAELKELRKAVARKEVELESKEAELEAAKKAGKAADKLDDDDEKGGKGGKTELLSDIKAFLTEQLKGVTTQVEGLKTDFEKRLGEVSGGLKAKTVGDYRAQQLARYKDVIVEDLVPEGLDTEEAVNSAIEKALERSKDLIYQEVDGKRLSLREIASTEKSKKAEAEKGGGTYTPPGNPPAPPDRSGEGGDVSGKVLLKDVSKMSPAEFAKHRDKLQSEVRQQKYTGVAEE